jgi:hypothetical protein
MSSKLSVTARESARQHKAGGGGGVRGFERLSLTLVPVGLHQTIIVKRNWAEKSRLAQPSRSSRAGGVRAASEPGGEERSSSSLRCDTLATTHGLGGGIEGWLHQRQTYSGFCERFFSCASTGGRSQSRAISVQYWRLRRAVPCAPHRAWRGAATAHPHATGPKQACGWHNGVQARLFGRVKHALTGRPPRQSFRGHTPKLIVSPVRG